MQPSDIRLATERILKLRNYPRKQAYLLAALEDLQAHFDALPEEAISTVLSYFGLKPELDSELSTLFHGKPSNPHSVRICTGPLCCQAGSRNLITALKASSDIITDESHCLGGCHHPPTARLNGKIISNASVDKIIGQLKVLKES